jgi:hypothetical protein
MVLRCMKSWPMRHGAFSGVELWHWNLGWFGEHQVFGVSQIIYAICFGILSVHAYHWHYNPSLPRPYNLQHMDDVRIDSCSSPLVLRRSCKSLKAELASIALFRCGGRDCMEDIHGGAPLKRVSFNLPCKLTNAQTHNSNR